MVCIWNAPSGTRLKRNGAEMLKLWGRTNSINVKKVLWMLDEIGQPYMAG